MLIRTHPITGAPILFAPERAERPRAFGGAAVERCPFCPGHEADTPPELARWGDPWSIRVFPNKYPASAGAEVIVESPRHEALFEEIEHGPALVRTYIERYRAHARAASVSLFRNEGPLAGASIPHVHSQVVPLPFVPPRIEVESRAFARAAHCPLCRLTTFVIGESESWRWLAPEGSAMPYQQWLVPTRHAAAFVELTELEQEDLAGWLRRAARSTRRLGGSFNWMFMDFPAQETAHCYVEIIPRLTAIAGLELGTGTFVEIIDPADAARRLRESDP